MGEIGEGAYCIFVCGLGCGGDVGGVGDGVSLVVGMFALLLLLVVVVLVWCVGVGVGVGVGILVLVLILLLLVFFLRESKRVSNVLQQ